MRLSPCVLVQPDGWARGEREGYGGPYDVTSLSLSHFETRTQDAAGAPQVRTRTSHGSSSIRQDMC